MKKLICTLLIFTALSASLVSCQNDDNINNPENSELPASETNEGKISETVDDDTTKRELDSATNMWYKLNDDGKSYTVYPGDLPDVVKELVFPGEYKGLPVTKVNGGINEQSVETIIISEGIQEIHARFDHSFGLKNIYIPSSVIYIWEAAFNSKPTMGGFPSGVKSNVIEKIVVAEGNPYYHIDGNCLIETKSKKVILGCNNSVIPVDGSVEIIGEAAFANCKSIETVILPRSVIELENSAFYNCDNLKQVYITSSASIDKKVINFDAETVFGYSAERNFYVPDEESLEVYSELFGSYIKFEIGTPDILSADEVRQIAWDHWNIEPNSKDPDTGFPFSIFVELHGDFYFVDLKWLVENHHFSNIDSIVMNAYTGKVIELAAKG